MKPALLFLFASLLALCSISCKKDPASAVQRSPAEATTDSPNCPETYYGDLTMTPCYRSPNGHEWKIDMLCAVIYHRHTNCSVTTEQGSSFFWWRKYPGGQWTPWGNQPTTEGCYNPDGTWGTRYQVYCVINSTYTTPVYWLGCGDE